MLLKFIEKLFKNIYNSNLYMQIEYRYLNENSKIKTLGNSRMGVKFTSYLGKNFTINFPEGYNINENAKTGDITITKNFYDYDFIHDLSFFKSYVHILISKLSCNNSIYSQVMDYEYMKEFIVKSPAFKNFEFEDIYILDSKALKIKSKDKSYNGGICWVIIPYGKELFNIRITFKEISKIDYEIVKEIIQSFNISPDYGQNKALYNSANSFYPYENIDIENGYISKTDAI